MEKAVIIGARFDGHAKVVLEILQAMNQYEIIGFIDDGLFGNDISLRGLTVIGNMKTLPQLIKEINITAGIVAIGNNPVRRQLGEKLKEYGLKLINAIHPTVHIDSGVEIGEGNVLCQGVIIVTGTKIGSFVNIHTGATIDHDNIIEDGANLGPGVHTAGRVKICKDAFLGTGAVAIPDSIVGEGAIVGAGAVILAKIEPFTVSVGVPAKAIKNINK